MFPSKWPFHSPSGLSSMHSQQDIGKEFHHGKLILLCAHLPLNELTSPASCLLSSQLFSEFRQKYENLLPFRLEFCSSHRLGYRKLIMFPNGKLHTQHCCHLGQGSVARQHLAYQMGLAFRAASGLSEWHEAGDQRLYNSGSAWTNCEVCERLGIFLARPPGCSVN